MVDLPFGMTHSHFSWPSSSARGENQPLSNQERNACNAHNVLNIRALPVLPSANAFTSQVEWREAVSETIANSDDFSLCPGVELLSPGERQVIIFFIYNGKKLF